MDPEAHDELCRLDEHHHGLADRVDSWLDLIEADPTNPVLRRRLIRPGRVWAISVPDPTGGHDYLILWDIDGDTPVIRYLGPDVLTPKNS